MNADIDEPTTSVTHENTSLDARVLAYFTDRRVGILAAVTVAAILELPNPLPVLPPVACLAVGVVEGVALAVVAENVP